MEKVAKIRKNLKEGIGNWEEEIFHVACSLSRKMAKDILEELDNELMRRREEGMEVVAFKEHWLVTTSDDSWLSCRCRFGLVDLG